MTQAEIPALLDQVIALQEVHGRRDPWRVLVICLLLNQTHGRAVAPLLPVLFRRFPRPALLAEADPRDLEDLLRPLGLWRRRADLLIRLSHEYAVGEWERPEDLTGVGRYGADAVRIFVDGDASFEPEDKVLRAVAARMRRGS